ncbi:MAG: nucleotidyltransferase domain-containing protein [Pseudomonadota bacterium]
MEIEQVSLEFVMTLRSSHEVNAVILFGSQAANTARPDSDVDLLVIVESGFEQTARSYMGRLFEVTFVTEKSTCDWWRSNPDHCVMLWRNAKVLHSKANTAKRLMQFAAAIEEEGKSAMSSTDIVKRHRAAAYQMDSLEALAIRDPLAANLVLGEKMAVYVGDYFSVRGLWLPAPKERPAMIRSLDDQVGALLDTFAQPASELDRKFAVARELINSIFQITEKTDIQ